MPRLWEKLNLGEHGEVLVLNAPSTFAAELKALQGVRVHRNVTTVKEVAFALAFVLNQAELNRWSAAVVAKAAGDALLWFAYPKGTSKRYTSDINRDKGWDVLRAADFDCVRQVAIDDDWSALRFRRTKFINHRSRAARL
ncbi:MAG TPA: hypothetical protein VNV61_14765 [Steroidobacteraceae bacterium]|jgi:hypothetical protein|nr:hypothetical protein [Steroidobacteraceae bacterium]